MIRQTSRLIAVMATAALVVVACGDDDDNTGDTGDTESPAATPAPSGTASPTTPASSAADGSVAPTEQTDAAGGSEPTTADTGGDDGGSGWTVSTDDCVDPDRANEPIEGTVDIASAGPLSGGPAATAFAPVIDGVKAYIEYANENELLPGYEITITYGDDQYDPSLTPDAINNGLDAGADLISGIIGTPPNLAVRDLLNEECVPHLEAGSGDPAFGDPVEYPWTVGGNLPYDVEAKAYAEIVAEEFPDGATAALFYVNNDAGLVFKEAFEEAAGEANIELVDDQTIEAAESAPPSAQVSSIAGNAAQCHRRLPARGAVPDVPD